MMNRDARFRKNHPAHDLHEEPPVNPNATDTFGRGGKLRVKPEDRYPVVMAIDFGKGAHYPVSSGSAIAFFGIALT